MSEPAIKVEDVSKLYRLGEGGRYDRHLSAAVTEALGAPFRFLRSAGRDDPVPKIREPKEAREKFWALRDVSLEVPQGQVLGMIGANGAGKSTLLKMLARITPPTTGRITLQGQVGSLLEVGTGFHPELSGRENIFLNGSILGMRRREIEGRYDEIVEFSGLEEQFIETPVKRYSSGMFVRLAFAVAAHLDPEILLVDEVLSVGDAEFQRKCLKKMEQIAHHDGRTIVFVSHGLSSVEKLCDRVVVIEGGRIVNDGAPEAMSASYLQRVEPVRHEGVAVIPPDASRSGSGEIQLTRVSLVNDDGDLMETVHFGEPFTVVVEAEASKEVPAVFWVIVSTPNGGSVLSARSSDRGAGQWDLERGQVEVRARLEATLLPGEFVIDVAVAHPDGKDIDYIERVLAFTASSEPADGGGDRYPWGEGSGGAVRPDSDWEMSRGGSAKRDQPVTL